MASIANYIVLDIARMGGLLFKTARETNPAEESLYRGNEESMAIVAPHLFSCKDDEFVKWFLRTSWGKGWGLMIKSPLSAEELNEHFRKFLVIGTSEQQELFFRFYDPAVFRIFMPTCDAAQLRLFFGDIDYFIVEDENNKTAIQCWHENGQMKSRKFLAKDILTMNLDVHPSTPSENALTYKMPPLPKTIYPNADGTFDNTNEAETTTATEAPATAKPQPVQAKPAYAEAKPVTQAKPTPTKPKWNMLD